VNLPPFLDPVFPVFDGSPDLGPAVLGNTLLGMEGVMMKRFFSGIRNLVWVLAPWVFVAITFKEWILVLDG